jgi:hypothetical protein
MAATHLDLGLRCIKYLLCAVNFLFVVGIQSPAAHPRANLSRYVETRV